MKVRGNGSASRWPDRTEVEWLSPMARPLVKADGPSADSASAVQKHAYCVSVGAPTILMRGTISRSYAARR